MRAHVEIPESGHYILHDVAIPSVYLEGSDELKQASCAKILTRVTIEVQDGRISSIRAAGSAGSRKEGIPVMNAKGSIALPTFVDLHTHLDTCHTAGGSTGDACNGFSCGSVWVSQNTTWQRDDMIRRGDFVMRSAYAHGTSAIRTHIVSNDQKQLEVAWEVFSALRKRWKGKVDLQGGALVPLGFYSDEVAARRLLDVVTAHGGILGAAVGDIGRANAPGDTAKGRKDTAVLLERVFTLAKAHNLDLDFHVDEFCTSDASGLLAVAEATIKHAYQGRVTCGPCCSLAALAPSAMQHVVRRVKQAGIHIACMPLMSDWIQDRGGALNRTPLLRGVPLVHELRSAGVPVSFASGNVRDSIYPFGDLDMLHTFSQATRICHLGPNYSEWVASVTSIPAAAMRAEQLTEGAPANLIIFRAKSFNQLLCRPHLDRAIIRDGVQINARPPDYGELDYIPLDKRYIQPSPEAAALQSPKQGALRALRGGRKLTTTIHKDSRIGRTCAPSRTFWDAIEMLLLFLVAALFGAATCAYVIYHVHAGSLQKEPTLYA